MKTVEWIQAMSKEDVEAVAITESEDDSSEEVVEGETTVPQEQDSDLEDCDNEDSDHDDDDDDNQVQSNKFLALGED